MVDRLNNYKSQPHVLSLYMWLLYYLPVTLLLTASTVLLSRCEEEQSPETVARELAKHWAIAIGHRSAGLVCIMRDKSNTIADCRIKLKKDASMLTLECYMPSRTCALIPVERP